MSELERAHKGEILHILATWDFINQELIHFLGQQEENEPNSMTNLIIFQVTQN